MTNRQLVALMAAIIHATRPVSETKFTAEDAVLSALRILQVVRTAEHELTDLPYDPAELPHAGA
jgi:chorismate mutase